MAHKSLITGYHQVYQSCLSCLFLIDTATRSFLRDHTVRVSCLHEIANPNAGYLFLLLTIKPSSYTSCKWDTKFWRHIYATTHSHQLTCKTFAAKTALWCQNSYHICRSRAWVSWFHFRALHNTQDLCLYVPSEGGGKNVSCVSSWIFFSFLWSSYHLLQVKCCIFFDMIIQKSVVLHFFVVK